MGFRSVFFAGLSLALCVSAVNAYTVVMRDGRRVEIPNEFTVTSSTLTYEIGNGIQRTIQLNTVDIAATERANGEAQGALLTRANAPKAAVPQTSRAGVQRSITNADLEKYRRARLENEKDREELGLPSVQERQREVAEIDERTAEQVRNIRAQEEAYWRSRADALRAENEAQMQSGGQRSADIPWSFSSGPFLPFDGVGFGFDGRFNRFGRFRPSPFDGFLATPITPFPRFPFNDRRPVFRSPNITINPRPSHMRHGSRR
jgi:hypothetical protein